MTCFSSQKRHFVPLYLRHAQDVGENYYVGGGLFLLVFIAIGAFVFANLVVAVVVTNLVSTFQCPYMKYRYLVAHQEIVLVDDLGYYYGLSIV